MAGAHRLAVARSATCLWPLGARAVGRTTKTVALVDVLGNLVRFLLLPGQAHDMKGVAPLIKGVSFDALLADKAFDADWLLQDLDERGATAVIPPKTNSKLQLNYDATAQALPHRLRLFLRSEQALFFGYCRRSYGQRLN